MAPDSFTKRDGKVVAFSTLLNTAKLVETCVIWGFCKYLWGVAQSYQVYKTISKIMLHRQYWE